MNTSEVKVGAITLGGVGLLALIISFLGAFSFFDNGYQLHIAYPQVAGLKEGNMVRYAGVPVGVVKSLEVKPDKIEVNAHINKGVQIPQGAVFTLGADGIMGEKFVDIQPPQRVTGNFIEPETNLTGTESQGLDAFMASSTKVLAKVEGIADALNNVFGDAEVQKSMRDGFVNARDISDNMNRFTKVMADVAERNQGEITSMVGQLNEMTGRMNSMAAHLDSVMEGADANGETGRNVARIAQNLADSSKRVEEISTVMATLVKDPQTSADIKATLHNAREASEKANKALKTFSDIKMSPQVGIGHSASGNDWRTNLGVGFAQKEGGGFGYLGAADFGDNTKLDLYAGKRFNDLSVSAGAMQGSFGVGLGYDVGKRFKLYSQLYDFNDAKVRVGGEYKLSDQLSIFGESLDVRNGDSSDTYIGVRSYF